MAKTLLVAVLALLIAATPVAAFTPVPNDKAGWSVRCEFSHSAKDDPIVAPAQPGATHLHDFLGNKTTNAFRTYESLLGGSTTCRTLSDTGAYWAPALYNNGVKINPTNKPIVYYRKKDYDASVRVEAFPPDLRVVSGNAKATSPAENPLLDRHIWYQCDDGSKADGVPPSSCSVGILDAVVTFPSCWDGISTHGNDSAHMTWPRDGFCPAGWHPLPRLQQTLRYPVGTGRLNITLSSGPSYTLHADFLNAWQQDKLQTLVDNCLNADIDCGANPNP